MLNRDGPEVDKQGLPDTQAEFMDRIKHGTVMAKMIKATKENNLYISIAQTGWNSGLPLRLPEGRVGPGERPLGRADIMVEDSRSGFYQ